MQTNEAHRYQELVHADRVHSKVYTDPTIFRDEIERIFHKGWVYIGHESEIPEPGDFRARHIGFQPVIYVRGDDRKIRVLMNRCTHRGPVVCVNDRGNSKNFTCPYHGWSFRNTGELAGIPYRGRYGDEFSASDYGLRPAPRYAAYRGFMFASATTEGPTLEEHLGPLGAAEIDVALDLSPVGEIAVSAGTHKYGYAGNWKLQLENSVDAYHLNSLHHSYLKIARERSGMDNRILGTDVSPGIIKSLGNGHVCWDRSPLGHEMESLAPVSPRSSWIADYRQAMIERHGEAYARTLLNRATAHVLIFPNLVLISSQIRVIRPISVDQTEVFLSPTLLNGVPDELNVQNLRGYESFYGPAGGGATDDLEIFERQTEGFNADVDPWIILKRGFGKERREQDGSVIGQITDELGSRAIFDQWRKLMCTEQEQG